MANAALYLTPENPDDLVGVANTTGIHPGTDNRLWMVKPDGTKLDVGATREADVSAIASSVTGAAIGGLTKSNVGLANVDNTSDTSKPISIATAAALALKASTSDLATKANASSLTALENTVGAIADAQAAGRTAYLTYSAMAADTSQDTGTVADVGASETDVAKRGSYQWNGTAWVFDDRSSLGLATLKQLTALIYGDPPNIAINTVAKTLTINGARVIQGARTIVVSNKTVSLASVPAYQYVVANMSTGDISLIATSGVASATNSQAIIGMLLSGTTFVGAPNGYTLNGVVIGAPTIGSQIAFGYSDASGIIVDQIAKTITFNGVRVFAGKVTNSLSTTLSYSGLTSASHFILYNCAANSVRIVSVANLTTATATEFILARLSPASGDLHGFSGGYSIGTGKRSFTPLVDRVLPRNLSLGWELPSDFTCPPLPSYTEDDDLPYDEITTDDIYEWYDALVDAYPDYVTRTELGVEPGDDTPIYEYRFKPKFPPVDVSNLDGIVDSHIKILIQGGIHNEWMSYVYPFHFMDLVCNNWQDSPLLKAIRFGVEVSVIPCVSPYGINHNQYQNSNNVNINRNYPVEWSLVTGSSSQNSGATPLSEEETQCSLEHMQAFRPHIFLDCHSFGAGTADRFLWYPSVSSIACNVAAGMLTRLATKWQAENSWMPAADKLGTIADSSAKTGSAGRSADALGAISCTCETATSIYQEPGRPVGSALAVRYATESFGNFILGLLKKLTN